MTPSSKGNGSGSTVSESTPSSFSSSEGKTSNPKGKGKVSDQPMLTLDQKASQGIIGGSLSKEEILEYTKEHRCFTCGSHEKGLS